MNLTNEQEEAVQHIKTWLAAGIDFSFRLGGLAGTGKSWLAPRLPELLGLPLSKVRYITPTNRAARVLQVRLQEAGVPASARTLHSEFFRPRDFHCQYCNVYKFGNPNEKCHVEGAVNPKCKCGLSFNPKELQASAPDLVICDEASMVDEEKYDEIISLLPGSRFLFIGDHGQLPPVGDKHNLMEKPDFELKEQQRTGPDSLIPTIARQVRDTGELDYDRYSDLVMKIRDDDDFEVDELDQTTGITYFRNPSQHGRSYVGLNNMWREMLGRGEMPEPGDRVLARRVKEHRTLKGSLGIIEKIQRSGLSDSDFYQAQIRILEEEFTYAGFIATAQFNNPNLVKIRSNVDLWDYGYSMTCHSAQGTEFDSVIVFEPTKTFRKWIGREVYARWLYTAITRSKRQLIVIG